MPWKPGQAGNPRGRPIDAQGVKELAQSYSRAAMELLGSMLSSKKRPDLAVRAAEAILNRGFGQPKAEIEISKSPDTVGIAEMREAAREVLSDSSLRVGIRAALRGVSAPVNGMNLGVVTSTLDVTPIVAAPPIQISDALRIWWIDVLAKYPRIAIAGGPRTGKTTLAICIMSSNRKVVHTDDWIDRVEWDGVPTQVIAACGDGPVIVEGVQVARALRKGLRVDAVVWLETPRREQTRKQLIMLAGIRTVFNEWLASPQRGEVPMLCPPEGA